MKKEEMEKYSVWVKVNRYIEGPLFVLSIIYIIFYLAILILSFLHQEIFKLYILYLGVGLIFFIFSIYIAFTGLLLKGINRSKNK